jgi:uncharacterized protein YgiM (DUF1202 family)
MLGGKPVEADGYTWYAVLAVDRPAQGWVASEFVTFSGEGDGAFSAGDHVVVATDGLNLREDASLDADVIKVLPEGTWLTVQDGPVTADGYAWYEVETTGGTDGWVAGTYLAMATGSELETGDAVRVVDGALNLRSAPSISADVLRVLDDNEALIIKDGPVVADGYTWYKVWNFGGTGWAAGEYLQFDPNGFPGEDGA